MSAGRSNAWVVDASVAIKWHLTDEEHTDKARLILSHFSQGQIQLLAPSHIRYEVPSAITAATLGRKPRISPKDGLEAIEEFFSLGLKTVDTDDLVLAAYPLVHKHGCPFYDALYLAVAQDLDVPLVTADRRLYQRICHLPKTVWLGDYPLEDSRW